MRRRARCWPARARARGRPPAQPRSAAAAPRWPAAPRVSGLWVGLQPVYSHTPAGRSSQVPCRLQCCHGKAGGLGTACVHRAGREQRAHCSEMQSRSSRARARLLGWVMGGRAPRARRQRARGAAARPAPAACARCGRRCGPQSPACAPPRAPPPAPPRSPPARARGVNKG